jgi:predicted nucleic acid-binding protein
MKQMSDRYFVDTNILIYAVSSSLDKKQKAIKLLNNKAVVSTQVLSESINVMRRKLNFSYSDIRSILEAVVSKIEVYPVQFETIQSALQISERYGFSYYDSQIVASAIEHHCEVLYSEDMQHQQVINSLLTIKNPFI